MNNPIPPSSLGPLPSKESFEKRHVPHYLSTSDRTPSGRGKLLLVLFLLSVATGGLYLLHPDIGIGTAIVAMYAGLYWAFRKTQGPTKKAGYPVIRYRGHPRRKGGFFS